MIRELDVKRSEELAARAWELARHCSALQEESKSLVTRGDPDTDMRPGYFGRAGVNFMNLSLSLTYLAEQLLHFEWWDRPGVDGLTNDQKMANANAYWTGVSFGAFHVHCANEEYAVRMIARALDPDEEALRGIWEVRSALLKSLDLKGDDIGAYFSLMSALRNCIHNGGVFRDPSQEERTVVYEGTEYRFKRDFPPNCVTPDFLVERMKDGVEIVSKIVSHPDVAGVDHIEDLYDRLGEHETIAVATTIEEGTGA